ncbi:MAG: wax ester/triacylglycerol synthase family O-acyltransferase [Acidimicrobiales bacterium]
MTITPAKHDKPRTIESSDRMTEHEALMWNVEKDPWLNPSGAALVLLDKPLDMAAFRQVMRNAVAHIPRFRQRVVPGFGRISTPAWAPDAEFDLDHHLRHITLPDGGSERELFDLATRLYQEPLDRTRPLWRFVAIDGLESGGGALWMLTHHAVADGIGQIRLSELYQSLSPDDPLPPEVDLEQIIADDVAAYEEKEAGGDLATDLRTTVTRSTTHLVRRQLGLTRRFAAEVAMWPADPTRANERLDELAATARSSVGQLVNTGGEATSGSPLWKERSRHRHLEHVRVPLDQLKAAAKRHDATINDAFLTGMVEAVVRYHGTHDTPLESINTSFVLSTRKGSSAGGNSFVPVPVRVSGHEMSITDRLDDVKQHIARAKDDATKGGGVTILSGVVNLLPTSVITRAARAQASKLDLATSNLRSAPFPVYVVGSRVMGTVTMGPLAGTPCNATAMSSENNFDIGLFIDPTAIEDPAEFRRHVAESFADLLATL